jgi:hypothetical protein
MQTDEVSDTVKEQDEATERDRWVKQAPVRKIVHEDHLAPEV